MAEDDSRSGSARRRTFQEIAADGMELPLVKARTAAAEAKKEEEEKKRNAIPLGTWAEDLRGAPNVVLRSALFCAGKPTKLRKSYRDHPLPAAIGTTSITYTGLQLYQHELDVWLEIVHRCRLQPAGTKTSFHVHSFLRTLRRCTGNKDHKQLHGTIGLLQATSIKVVPDDPSKNGFRGQLVRDFVFNDEIGRWEVGLHPEITELFAPKDHTWLHMDARLDLGKNYLAKWLHGYFSSHRKPLPISVGRLRELSGSANAELRFFRRRLREALTGLEAVEHKRRRGFAWRIDGNDLVHVVRESGN